MLHAAELEPEMEARPAGQQDEQHDRQYQNTMLAMDQTASLPAGTIGFGSEDRDCASNIAQGYSVSCNHGAQLGCFTNGQVPVEASVEFGPTIFGPPATSTQGRR
jgi:hypothetical protein